jgi:hypothetical protein
MQCNAFEAVTAPAPRAACLRIAPQVLDPQALASLVVVAVRNDEVVLLLISNRAEYSSYRDYAAPMQRMSDNSSQCKNYPI